VKSLPEAPASAPTGQPRPCLGSASGLASGLGAYTLWGVFPIYFHAVAYVPPLVVLCHRVLFAVSLAIAFGLYGLVRKKLDVNSLHGLLVESALLLPVAVSLLIILPAANFSANTWLLLSLSGIITAVPLLLFGAAVRRLQLSTLGFLQYIGPTLQFLLAICVFQEPLNPTRLLSFALCWLAIAIYVADSVLNRRPAPAVADEPE